MRAIYALLAGPVERILSIPAAPSAPPGDEGTTRVFRASPRYYLYRLLSWGLRRLFSTFVLVSALLASSSIERELGRYGRVVVVVVLSSYALQTLLSWVALRLDYEKRWYLVTDRSLRIRQGVVGVSEMTITFANIQNLSISQGPLQRLFGISDLRVDTAGGSAISSTGQHAGVSFHTAFFQGVDSAEHIRELVQERLRRVRDAGLGDPDDPLSLPPPAAIAGQASTEALSVLRELRNEAVALRASSAALDA